MLALSWSASSYPVRNPSPTLFRLALPREVDLRRSATPRSSAPLREREEKTERERELCACVTFARGVARFVKKASGGDARVALHLGHGDTAQPVCPRCAARARADYASPFTVHQHLRLLRANTPTGIIPIVPALSSLSQQPHVQHTHTTHTYPACNEFLENPERKRSDIQNIVKSDISLRSSLSLRRRETEEGGALFHSAIKNIYTSYETTSRNIRRGSRMHEY